MTSLWGLRLQPPLWDRCRAGPELMTLLATLGGSVSKPLDKPFLTCRRAPTFVYQWGMSLLLVRGSLDFAVWGHMLCSSPSRPLRKGARALGPTSPPCLQTSPPQHDVCPTHLWCRGLSLPGFWVHGPPLFPPLGSAYCWCPAATYDAILICPAVLLLLLFQWIIFPCM